MILNWKSVYSHILRQELRSNAKLDEVNGSYEQKIVSTLKVTPKEVSLMSLIIVPLDNSLRWNVLASTL